MPNRITSRETLERLLSLRDELGTSGHIIAPPRVQQYQETLDSVIAAVREIADPPPPPSNVLEFRAPS